MKLQAVILIAMIGVAYGQFDSFDLQDAASEDDLSVAETAGVGGGKGGAAGGKVTHSFDHRNIYSVTHMCLRVSCCAADVCDHTR